VTVVYSTMAAECGVDNTQVSINTVNQCWVWLLGKQVIVGRWL